MCLTFTEDRQHGYTITEIKLLTIRNRLVDQAYAILN